MAALRTPNLKKINSGAKVPGTPFAGSVLLTPSNSANLPKKAPERSPKTNTFSGYLEITGSRPARIRLAISTAEVLTGGGFSIAGITA